MKNLQNFIKDESGATAIEYGLLAALISVVGITAFTSAGENIAGIFTTISGQLEAADATAAAGG